MFGGVKILIVGLLDRDRMELKGGDTYHAVTGEIRVGLQDTVCGRVIASSVHGIRTSLVERCWESDIFGIPAGDGDFCHSED